MRWVKVGKARAGRQLDGREWSEFPQAVPGGGCATSPSPCTVADAVTRPAALTVADVPLRTDHVTAVFVEPVTTATS